MTIWATPLTILSLAFFQWPQLGHVDYEEWFDSPDIASAPLGEVACIIAELYRGLFEVRAPLIRILSGLITHPLARSRSELDLRSRLSARSGRSGPEMTLRESVLANCDLPGSIPTTALEFIPRSSRWSIVELCGRLAQPLNPNIAEYFSHAYPLCFPMLFMLDMLPL
jgi:hypothetical protein